MNSALKWMPLVAAVALATTGCAREGYYHDRNIDYAEARSSAPLTLPDSRDTRRYRDAMPVPEAAGNFRETDAGFSAPSPERLAAGRANEQDFVERRDIGQDSWLVVGADPGVVWPQLEDFARTRGLAIVSSDSSRGVIQTSQARLSVRQGLRADESEVRCDQSGVPVAACLEALEDLFEARSASASASSLAAQRLATEDRLQLEQQGDDWVVRIPLEIDRAWAELSHQLEQDFTVEERRELLESTPADYSYLIRYLPLSERRGGFWEGLVSSESPRDIRLVLESTGPQSTVLRAANASERDFAPSDQRELLERLASLLR